MLRCSRLIGNSLNDRLHRHNTMKQNNMYRYDYPAEAITETFLNIQRHEMRLQPGDIMTGWEIIASLPLEQQRTFKGIQNGLESYGFTFLEHPTENEVFDMCALYRWNGESWVKMIGEDIVDGIKAGLEANKHKTARNQGGE